MKQQNRIDDRAAVAAGDFTVEQFNRVRTACFLCTRRLTRLWQHQTLKLNERATHHLAAMLRSMRQFDPVAYAEVRFVVFTYACLVL